MKKSIFIALTLAISFILVYSIQATACHVNSVAITADCVEGVDGHYINYTVSATTDTGGIINVAYTLIISSSLGDVVITGYLNTGTVLTDSYGPVPCSTYQITGNVASVLFDSGPIICETADGCTRTPGYWKNHPEAWPVYELEIGGILYSETDLMAMLSLKGGTMDEKLIKHLIAAEFNVLSAAPIVEAIGLAEDYLYDGGGDDDYAEILKDVLDDYNNSIECED